MTAQNAPRYVAYYRVSTQKQGKSGLGLEAQKEAVRQYVERNGVLLTPAIRKLNPASVLTAPSFSNMVSVITPSKYSRRKIL